MTAKKGRGLLMVYTDVGPEHEDEFNRWYNEEHIPERLSIPGVLSAARYTALLGGPKYLACYELAEPEAWQYWLNNPTEWSRRMSPGVVGINYIRNLYRLIYPGDVSEETAQADMSPVLLVGRMSVPPELEDQFNQAYNTERLPLCYDVLDTSGEGDFRPLWANRNIRLCMRCSPVNRDSPDQTNFPGK